MNLLDILRGLARRWYIVVPGAIIAIAAAIGAWTVIPPAYERSASQLLLPGRGTLPEGASNPYLYLGGLTAPADVLVRAVGSEDSLHDLIEANPGAEIEISRDPTASGPVILIKVTSGSDEQSGAIVNELVSRTAATLDQLQAEEGISQNDRITITPVSIDQQSRAQQRDRLVATAGVGIGVVLLTIVLASVIDGLATRSGRRGRGAPSDSGDSTQSGDSTDAGKTDSPSEGGADDEASPEPGSGAPADETAVEIAPTAGDADGAVPDDTSPIDTPAYRGTRGRAPATVAES